MSKQWQYLIVWKKISSNFFKNKITSKLPTYRSYIHSFNCVQAND